ncbi:MAG: tetratricopeptide (TPR) repeat protein [Kiritimatiellia bacterium]|jgi:tetratricopeptide (TPR) repeat protein
MNPFLQRASLLLEQNRIDLAIKELHQALAQDPEDPSVHALLAICYADQNKHEAALDEAHQAIFHAPDQPFPQYALAKVYAEANKFKEAQQAIDAALAMDPADPDYWFMRSAILYNQRRWKDALEAANTALSFDAEHIAANNLRASALVQLNEREAAGRTLDGNLQRDPENAWTHANKGWSLLDGGDHKEALESFREALRLEPDNAYAKSGVVEALKAKNPIYRLLLKYFLWMGKLSQKHGLMVILGLYFGYRLLLVVTNRAPSLQVLTLPITIVYIVFAYFTWTAMPIFNLLLRLNAYGRHALSRDQIVASNWVGLSLLLGFLLVIAGFLNAQINLILYGMAFGVLVIPIAGSFNCDRRGKAHKILLGFTGILLLVATASYAYSFLPSTQSRSLASIFGLGIFAYSWVAGFIIMRWG